MSDAPEQHSPESQQAQACLEFYKEQCAHGRHIEMQRHAVAAMFLAASGILLSVMGSLSFSIHSIPLALGMVGLGIFGHRFVALYGVKWDELSERRNHYRVQVQELLELQPPQGATSKGSVRRYWQRIFTAVTGIGILCLVISGAIAAARMQPCPDSGAGQGLWAQLAGCELEGARGD